MDSCDFLGDFREGRVARPGIFEADTRPFVSARWVPDGFRMGLTHAPYPLELVQTNIDFVTVGAAMQYACSHYLGNTGPFSRWSFERIAACQRRWHPRRKHQIKLKRDDRRENRYQ